MNIVPARSYAWRIPASLTAMVAVSLICANFTAAGFAEDHAEMLHGTVSAIIDLWLLPFLRPWEW